MERTINLKSIRKYNPAILSDEDVIANYVVRDAIFEKLLKQVSDEEANSIPQHHLIIGQRGMGKTSLLKRLEVEFRTQEDLARRFVPLQYPEEQYNIDRLSKFWLNTVDVLIDYLDLINNKELVKKYDKKIKTITAIKDEVELVDAAQKTFDDIINTLGKRPILLIDNINELFAALKKEEQWTLRNIISGNGAPIFVGASSSSLEESTTYEDAFYDYFKVYFLDALSYEEFHKLIFTLASNLDDSEIKTSFKTNELRIKSLYRLTGGNIRTAIILFSSLSNGFGDSVADDLEGLLDEFTPLYKARIEELPEQLKGIVDAIALHHDTIDLQTLRDLTHLDNNTLSPQVRRLRQMGWLNTLKIPKVAGNRYEISERFFNVWYLMRNFTNSYSPSHLTLMTLK